MILPRRIAVALAAVVVAQSAPPLQREVGAQSDSAIARQVEEIENRRLAAMEKGDIDEVARFIADDFMVTSGTGRNADRDEYLKRLRAAAMPRPHLVHDEVRIRVYGDTAIITGRSHSVVDGREQPAQVRYTHVYVKRGGAWQMVAMHVSSIAAGDR